MSKSEDTNWDELTKFEDEIRSELEKEYGLQPLFFYIRGGVDGFERGLYCVEFKIKGRIGFAEWISWPEVYHLIDRHLAEIEAFEVYTKHPDC